MENFGKKAMSNFMAQGEDEEGRRDVGLGGGGGGGLGIMGGGGSNSTFAFQPYAGNT